MPVRRPSVTSGALLIAAVGACTNFDSDYQWDGVASPVVMPTRPARPSPPRRRRSEDDRTRVVVDHVLSTGHGNAIGLAAAPVLSTVQPFDNLMFDVGLATSAGCVAEACTYRVPSAFAPLVEGAASAPVETMSAGMANLVARRAADLAAGPHPVLVSVHGRREGGYACLRKGGCGGAAVGPFDEAMRQVADAQALSASAGLAYAVRAVTTLDGVAGSAELIAWQRDYQAGVEGVVGPTGRLPLLVGQCSHCAPARALDELAAHTRAPGDVVVVGPSYALPYADDCTHLTSHGARWLGEYFGKAYARIVLEGERWEPVRPRAVDVLGEAIRVRFHVLHPPLTFDTQRVGDPGDLGFEVLDAAGGAVRIVALRVTAEDEVTLTLDRPPPAEGRVRYAVRPAPDAAGCTRPRGNLRASDPGPSLHGYPLYDWAVHFDEPLP